MKKLLKNLSKEKKLLVIIGLNQKNEEGYMCVFAYDVNTSYYLYGCPLTEDVENYLGSITFWECFKKLSKIGIDTVDMEGINSPNRGGLNNLLVELLNNILK